MTVLTVVGALVAVKVYVAQSASCFMKGRCGLMYLAVTYWNDFDEGWKLSSVKEFNNKEDALLYKRRIERESQGDECVCVYEAKRID